MDIKSIIFNQYLEEEVYMEQPEGFECRGKEYYVCRMKKSPYSLKKAPRALVFQA